MKYSNRFFSGIVLVFVVTVFMPGRPVEESGQVIEYRVDLKKQGLRFFWRNENRQPFRSIQNLKDWLAQKGQKLVFAMNGGMYKTDNSPLGLFVEDGKVVAPLNTRSGHGNFYLKPNGVFYITTSNEASICTTEKFKQSAQIKYATQSGPMLVSEGLIHPAFKKGSTNVNIRNGVGLLADGRVLFAMSTSAVSLYDFAAYFKNAGCKNALYLDGFVSKTYLPAKNWMQTGGNFGVIIGEVAPE